MATFQLAGIPNFGVNNMNAPGASVPGPVQYANDNPGLTILQGLSGVAQIDQQAKQEQALQQYQQGLGAALANNDRARMKQLYAEYPQFFEQTQKGLGLVDTDRNKAIGEAAMELRLASQQGPEAMQAALQKNAAALRYLGATPDTLFTSWQKNPQQFEKTADLIHLHASPDKFFTERGQQEDRQIKRDALADTSARGWAGINQAARFHADDMEMKKLNYQNRLLENQYKATDNDLKRQELQQKIDANKQIIHAKADASLESIDRLDQAMGVADDLESLIKAHPTAVSRNQGGILGKFWNLTDDTQTLASKTEELNMKLILPMLRGTFGANPTEGEREALKASANNLSNAKSESDYRKELVRVRNIATRLKNREQVKLKSFGADDYIRQQQQAADTGSQAATKYLPRRNTPSASQPASNEELASKYGL